MTETPWEAIQGMQLRAIYGRGISGEDVIDMSEVRAMSETPEERRERLLQVLDLNLPMNVQTPEEIGWAFDALLAALEPPVADMVRRGVDELTVSVVEAEESTVHLVHMYRPRGDA